MDVPTGFLGRLWNFISFLPFFFMLLILGVIKAAIIGPVVTVIIVIGNSAVILGLWPAHFFWTFYCLTKTKRLRVVLKILVLLFLPVPLVLWPILGVVGSFLVGFGYGFFSPLIATFEAVGEQVIDKLFHFVADGCWSTVLGGCTVVRDFTDFCFHSYFSLMDELSEAVPEDEHPLNIKLSMLPSCFLVCLLAIIIDVPMVLVVALWKSPYMLFKGWKRLLEDLIGREGPFLETVCVPFAGLAIILWPIAVLGAVIGAFICSFFLALYGGIVVHQEMSFQLGLAYILSIISMFDEYTNDLLYMREGSCLPRPTYRRNTKSTGSIDRKRSIDNDSSRHNNGKVGSPYNSKLGSGRSKTLKKTIQQFTPIQVWDWLFRSCELNGRILLHSGLINIEDIEASILKGKCRKLSIKLPAYCILQCLLRSAKSDTPGLLITDDIELTKFNLPKDKFFEWFIEPLVIMKEQIKGLQLDENEEACLSKLLMCLNNERPEDWNESGFPTDNNLRRAQLQAIFRRLQGIVASLSRMPTFWRRFKNLVKVLYVESMEYGGVGEVGGSSTLNRKNNKSVSLDVQLDDEMVGERPIGDDEIV